MGGGPSVATQRTSSLDWNGIYLGPMAFLFEQDEGDSWDPAMWKSPRSFQDTTKELGPFPSQTPFANFDVERNFFPMDCVHEKGLEKICLDHSVPPPPVCDDPESKLAGPKSQEESCLKPNNAPASMSPPPNPQKLPRNRRDELYNKQTTIRRRVKSCPVKGHGSQFSPTPSPNIHSPRRSKFSRDNDTSSSELKVRSAALANDERQRLASPSSSVGPIELTELSGVYTGTPNTSTPEDVLKDASKDASKDAPKDAPKDAICSPGRLRSSTRRLHSRKHLARSPSPPSAFRSPSPSSTKRYHKSVPRCNSDGATTRTKSRRNLTSPPPPSPVEPRAPAAVALSPHHCTTLNIARKSTAQSDSGATVDLYWKRISARPPAIRSLSTCLVRRHDTPRVRCNSDSVATRPRFRRNVISSPLPLSECPTLSGRTPSPHDSTSSLPRELPTLVASGHALDLDWKRIPASQRESTLMTMTSPSRNRQRSSSNSFQQESHQNQSRELKTFSAQSKSRETSGRRHGNSSSNNRNNNQENNNKRRYVKEVQGKDDPEALAHLFTALGSILAGGQDTSVGIEGRTCGVLAGEASSIGMTMSSNPPISDGRVLRRKSSKIKRKPSYRDNNIRMFEESSENQSSST